MRQRIDWRRIIEARGSPSRSVCETTRRVRWRGCQFLFVRAAARRAAGRFIIDGSFALCLLFSIVLVGCSRQPITPAKERVTDATPVIVANVTNRAWDEVV